MQPDIGESPKLCCLANRHNHKHKFPSNTGIAKASNCEIRSSQGSRGSCYCVLAMTSFVGGFGFRIPYYTLSQPRKKFVIMYVIFGLFSRWRNRQAVWSMLFIPCIFVYSMYWPKTALDKKYNKLQGVPLVTESGISLIILTSMKILQRNLNRSTFVVWEMKRNVSVVCVCSATNYCDMEQRSASRPGSVASGTPFTNHKTQFMISPPTCFDTGVPSSGSLRTHRITNPTLQFGY